MDRISTLPDCILHIEVPHVFKLPSSVFHCKTLVLLKLCGLLLVDTLGSVHLPALKTLHLDDFGVLEIRCLVEILRGCPVLEDFQATRIYISRDSDVVEFQTMPKLVRTYIDDKFGFQIPLKAVCNVEYLRYQKIELVHGNEQFNQECFPVFHNLIRLEVKFGSYIKWHSVFEMLKHCPKLQTFLLHKTLSMKPSPPEIWSCPQSVPECIFSWLRKCTILNYEVKECELQFAKYIMQNSRALQTMGVHQAHVQKISHPRDKHVMLQELAMCPRSSATCKLLFK